VNELEAALEQLRALPKPQRRAAALLANPLFQQAVALAEPLDDATLLALAAGEPVAGCVALEALGRRAPSEELGDALSERLETLRGQRGVFLLRALDHHVQERLVQRVLSFAGKPWRGAALEALKAIALRRGERVGPVEPGRAEDALELAEELGVAINPDFFDEQRWLLAARDVAHGLGRIGRVRGWGEAERLAGELHTDQALRDEVDALTEALLGEKPVLVVGPRGSGRMSRLRLAAARLAARGKWLTLEAAAAEVNAGMTYVGELEGRMRYLVSTLAENRVVWIVPEFDALLYAGVTRQNPAGGALDLLLAGLANHRVHVAGIVDAGGYERLVRERPAVRDAFAVVRIEPMTEARTLALVDGLGEPAVLREALALGRHFLGDAALPGALLSLLGDEVTLPAILKTISERSGLPLSLLDERERLDVDALRTFFSRRVIGQPEAVDCMVERVALVKSGLTDPTRPQAVLLFVGPTGTGKTEIAKGLAEYLFGSPDRMIRIDMSEYQYRGSAWRLQGDDEQREDRSLVGQIRRQPFSVVLLDEFEKADASVWDLFLQVFDDGRLSDPLGRVADFRHAVIIMTSNLGARVRTGTSLGFSPTTGGFDPVAVQKVVTKAFRPEFLNRIDRTVVFRPLTRPVMREILTAELDAVLSRRGLRARSWAVEFDDSAVEFLLTQGFTPDLGARPSKRAVERHFLTPLALAIAGHDVPEGDQFLFVRAGSDGLKVTFEDPDAPQEVAPAPAETTLRTLAREGGPGVELLEAAFSDVSGRLDPDAKSALLERMAEPGFWEDDGRVAVLSEIELRDRMEAGLRSAGSLLNRIRNSRRPPAALVRRAAQRLILLDAALDALAAGEPSDTVLRVDGDPVFGPRIVAMYQAWASERGMRLEVAEERGGRRFRWSATVSGFAARQTLAPESGFHVLEVPDGRGGYERRRVRVTVGEESARPAIVRRYRERPTPLVRDAVRGWRTGRLDAVLAGGFDLIE
jgi:ATP-dependent Clp protease ATP-binding subunit ClpC